MVGVLGDHAIDEQIEPIGDLVVELACGGEQAFLLGHHEFQGGLALKGEFSGEEVVEAAAQGVDVGSQVDRLGVAGLFGSHVQRGPQPGSALGHRHVVVCGLGQPEVGHLDVSGTRHQHVIRLDVSVDQAGVVCVHQCLGALDRHQHSVGDAEAAQLVDPVLHGLAVDVFDRHVVSTLVGFDGKDLEHVGVIEPGHRPSLAEEPRDEGLFLAELFREDLECDHAVESLLAGEVDLTHPALTEFPQQLEVAQFRRLALARGLLRSARRLRIASSHLGQVTGIRLTRDVGLLKTLPLRITVLVGRCLGNRWFGHGGIHGSPRRCAAVCCGVLRCAAVCCGVC